MQARHDVGVLCREIGPFADVGFEGRGCAISIASASLMTEMLKGRTVADQRVRMAARSACAFS